MNKIRILLADDNEMMRNALALFLEADADVDVVAQAVDGYDVLAQLDAACPDVICMDVNMGALNGMETTRQVLILQPKIRIIGLSAHADRTFVAAMVEAGALGYVVKSNAGAQLLAAIHAVHEGRTFFSPDFGVK